MAASGTESLIEETQHLVMSMGSRRHLLTEKDFHPILCL